MQKRRFSRPVSLLKSSQKNANTLDTIWCLVCLQSSLIKKITETTKPEFEGPIYKKLGHEYGNTIKNLSNLENFKQKVRFFLKL